MYLVFTRNPSESYRRQIRSLYLCLCYEFRALINSLVCWFCTSNLGLVQFQIVCMLTKQGQQQKQRNAHLCWEQADCEVPERNRVENFHHLTSTIVDLQTVEEGKSIRCGRLSGYLNLSLQYVFDYCSFASFFTSFVLSDRYIISLSPTSIPPFPRS